jgi:hypothetical protein
LISCAADTGGGIERPVLTRKRPDDIVFWKRVEVACFMSNGRDMYRHEGKAAKGKRAEGERKPAAALLGVCRTDTSLSSF